MKAYKYPYIPKEYYAAVMFACKMIRETGYKNKAISTAANYYGVDEDEVRKHVEKRAAAGQKGTKRGKYKWFVVGEYCYTDANGMEEEPLSIEIRKGLSAKTVLDRYHDIDDRINRMNDYGGAFAPYQFHSVLCECETQEEAETEARKQEKQRRKTDASNN